MGPHYYCSVINKTMTCAVQEGGIVLLRVTSTCGRPQLALSLSVSCDNSINIHNKDVFPSGKITKSQNHLPVPARHHAGCQGLG